MALGNKITMQQLAMACGVSRTTVSLILSGKSESYQISSKTKKLVEKKAIVLGFRANYFAQSLNQSNTGVIGLVFPHVREAFMNEIVHGAEEALYLQGSSLILCTSHANQEIEARHIRELLHRRVDGILLVFYAPFRKQKANYRHIHELLAQTHTPVVCIDRTLQNIPSHRVITDDFAIGSRAAHHLLAQKVNCATVISLDIPLNTVDDRIQAFYETAQKIGLNVAPKKAIMLKNNDRNSGDLFPILEKLMTAKSKNQFNIQGLFIPTSGLALRVRKLILDNVSRWGRTIGKDLFIVREGCDHEDLPTDLINIPIPQNQLGKRAVDMLLDLIQQNQLSTANECPWRKEVITLAPLEV